MNTPDETIVFTTTRINSDLNWHFLYACKRGFWKRLLLISFMMIVGLVLADVIPDLLNEIPRDFDFIIFEVIILRLLPCCVALLLFSYAVDYIIMSYMNWRMTKNYTSQTTEFSLTSESLYMKHQRGEGLMKYEIFQNIYLYRHLIVFKAAYNLFYIIPWRDIPAEKRDQVTEILTTTKAKLKI